MAKSNITRWEPICEGEVRAVLNKSFDSIRGSNFGVLDTPFSHTLSDLPKKVRSEAKGMVVSSLGQPGDVTIMEQGCCQGKGLAEAMNEARKHKENDDLIIGYGVTASPDLTGSLPGKVSPDEADQEKTYKQIEEVLGEGQLHRPFQPNGIAKVIAEDIHTVCSTIQKKFNLIFSDNTYYFLSLPWMALKKAVDSLKIGGVALIRGITQDNVYDADCRQVSNETVVEMLKVLNPGYKISLLPSKYSMKRGILVQKEEDVLFQTGLHVGQLVDIFENPKGEAKWLKSVFFEGKEQPEFLSLDSLT